MSKFIDLTGQKFGRLTVIKRVNNHITPSGQCKVQYLCKCECGNELIVQSQSLKNGRTQSCGCYKKDKTITYNTKNKKKYNHYDLSNEYGIGYTHNNNKPFYFDLEDYDKIKDYCWWEDKSGYILARNKDKTSFRIHRLIMDCATDMVVDHINHNKLDNRKENLRIVTRQQNTLNQLTRKNNTSGYKGVHWHIRINKWCASITYNYKTIYLGSFDNLDDAIKSRKEAEIKYFNEYRYKGDN